MIYISHYDSPLGALGLAERDGALAGLWMDGQHVFLNASGETSAVGGGSPVLRQAADWLDRYFAGEMPCPRELKLELTGSDFRRAVWELLLDIPYGETVSYGMLAKELSGGGRMSAQAVGGAVGHNPVSIIVPCHRVIGADGGLTGYAGGVDKKLWLLRHEGADIHVRNILQ